LMGDMTSERLHALLAEPFTGYVECRGDEAAVAGILASAAAGGQFCLALTTRTAFSIEAACLVCDGLAARDALPP
ncbi:hypothetical protein ACSTJG_25550, partial [Vibrio parahaemolyticus]